MSIKSYVIGIGELLWDVFPEGKKLGGAPVNFAFHATQLGVEGLAISAIGNDELGDEIVSILNNFRLQYDVQKVEYPTGTVQVTLNGNGIPQYEICEPVAWDYIGMKPEYFELAKNASAVCFGTLAQRGKVSAATIREFIGLVPESAYKVLDINLRQQYYSKELILESLNLCNVFKINDEEMEILIDMFCWEGSPEEIAKGIIEMFDLKLLILTCGINGSYLITPENVSFKETPFVEVSDTVGAGDVFTAAVVASLLNKKTIDEAHEIAVKLSAFVCTKTGAMFDYSRDLFLS